MDKYKQLDSMCYLANIYLNKTMYSVVTERVGPDKYNVRYQKRAIDSNWATNVLYEGTIDNCIAFLKGIVESRKYFKDVI